MTPRIELIYDADCPNVPAARAALTQACQKAGIAADWQEWNRAAAQTPAYAAQYGSPTVLIDGEDVAGASTEADAQACRVYRTHDGKMQGEPPAELIAARLGSRQSNTSWFGAVTAIGAGFASFLPVLTCPACWPAYAGVLGAMGISFLNYTPYLLPAVGVMLGLTLISLAMGARRRHGFGPLGAGLAAAVVMTVGRFAVAADPVVYLGFVILLVAAVWNAWPNTTSTECSTCAD